MPKPGAEELRRDLENLTGFANRYRSYISTLESVFGSQVPPHGSSLAGQREEIIRRAPRAQRALDASGVTLAITPPPAFGGHVRRQRVR
jgi:hypothetical protein